MQMEVPVNRTDKSIKRQMLEAQESEKRVDIQGVWGPSPLMNMKHFDLVKGMIVDFMHCIAKMPRSINERHMWKASDWLSWLIYYSLICMKGI